jgi:hypothetical protein
VGKIKNQNVVILIDLGSTHNFLAKKIAAILGIQPPFHDFIKVKVANSEEILSPSRSKGIKLTMQSFVFKVDLYILSLAGCDVVIGIQWLSTLGHILWNFIKLTMACTFDKRKCLLQGLVIMTNLSLQDVESLKLSHNERKGILLQLMANEGSQIQKGGGSNPKLLWQMRDSPLSAILQEYQDVFVEPIGLPPARYHDHSIVLK